MAWMLIIDDQLNEKNVTRLDKTYFRSGKNQIFMLNL